MAAFKKMAGGFDGFILIHNNLPEKYNGKYEEVKEGKVIYEMKKNRGLV